MQHVMHDVEHQVVVRRATVVRQLQLALEQVQEAAEVDVIGVPQHQGVLHGDLAACASRPLYFDWT